MMMLILPFSLPCCLLGQQNIKCTLLVLASHSGFDTFQISSNSGVATLSHARDQFFVYNTIASLTHITTYG
ncbi:unnamed protein product, partial [Sphenostylis stenocarpa]